MRKALTVDNILNQKVKRIPFDVNGRFYDAFRQPQDRGVWFVWGGISSGKSAFIMQLAKELAYTYKTFYNSLEEETSSDDFIERCERYIMTDVKSNFLAESYEYPELREYLDRRNSAKVVIIESATYFFESFEQYKEFRKNYRNKIIIITGHGTGNKTSTELEFKIQKDANMKIFVNGFLAICKGRTIGPNGGNFVIWDEGYEKLRGLEQ